MIFHIDTVLLRGIMKAFYIPSVDKVCKSPKDIDYHELQNMAITS